MRLADYSAQKMAQEGFACSCGKHHGKKTELLFCNNATMGEMLKERFPSYKILFVTDRPERTKMREFLSPDCLTVCCTSVLDVRELFAFPDTINLVVVYASGKIVEYVRYFAFVRGVKCIGICATADASCFYAENIGVSLLDREYRYFLSPTEMIFFNEGNLDKQGNSSIFLSLAVHSICVLEKRFLKAVLEQEYCEELFELAYDGMLSLTSIPRSPQPVKKLFEESFRYAFLTGENFFQSETEYLWVNLPDEEKLTAWTDCLDLYAIFFKYGTRSRYTSANYADRFYRAAVLSGKSELAISQSNPIPSITDLKRYELSFHRERGTLLCLAEDLKRRKQGIIDAYCSFGGVVKEKKSSALLKCLPELSSEYGIFCLMRDFGLFERK